VTAFEPSRERASGVLRGFLLEKRFLSRVQAISYFPPRAFFFLTLSNRRKFASLFFPLPLHIEAFCFHPGYRKWKSLPWRNSRGSPLPASLSSPSPSLLILSFPLFFFLFDKVASDPLLSELREGPAPPRMGDDGCIFEFPSERLFAPLTLSSAPAS